MRLLAPVTKASLSRSTLTSNIEHIDNEETCSAVSSFLYGFIIACLCHVRSYFKQMFRKRCEISPPKVTRLATCHEKMSVAKYRVYKQLCTCIHTLTQY